MVHWPLPSSWNMPVQWLSRITVHLNLSLHLLSGLHEDLGMEAWRNHGKTPCHPKKLLILLAERAVSHLDTTTFVGQSDEWCPKKSDEWTKSIPDRQTSQDCAESIHPLGIVVLSLVGTPIHVSPVNVGIVGTPSLVATEAQRIWAVHTSLPPKALRFYRSKDEKQNIFLLYIYVIV